MHQLCANRGMGALRLLIYEILYKVGYVAENMARIGGKFGELGELTNFQHASHLFCWS